MSMPSVEETVEIRAPIDEVFASITDPSRGSEWNPHVLEVKNISPGPMGIGKTWDQETMIAGKKTTLHCRVTEYRPPTFGALEISGGHTGRVTAECRPLPTGTELRQTIEFEPPGGILGRMGAKFLHPLIQKELRLTLNSLRESLELEAAQKRGPRTA